MIPPNRILDLIEAIEVSAEKRNYILSTKQRILISRLKVKAEKDMWVSNNYWELLCNLFNSVEGRTKKTYNLSFVPVAVAFVSIVILAIYLIIVGGK